MYAVVVFIVYALVYTFNPEIGRALTGLAWFLIIMMLLFEIMQTSLEQAHDRSKTEMILSFREKGGKTDDEKSRISAG